MPVYPVAVYAYPCKLSFFHLFWTVALEFKIAKAFVDVSLNDKCNSPFNVLYLILINLQIRMKYTPITMLSKSSCLFSYYDNNNKKWRSTL